MHIYFPQWQGAGSGKEIEAGAATIRQLFGDQEIAALPLSKFTAGKGAMQRFGINNFDAIYDQLLQFKGFLEKKAPQHLRVIGGDCGLEIVPVSYLNALYPNLGVIWFDAHADINTPEDSPSHNFHGMPLRTLLGEGTPEMDPLLFSQLKASQIHYLGLRDVDPAEQQRLDSGNIYFSREINISELIRVLKAKKVQQLYLHFDFDCLDPTAYNATYYQVHNGLSIEAATDCIISLARNFEVVGTSALESVAQSPADLAPIHSLLRALMK